MTDTTQDFNVICELDEEEEISTWTKSIIAVDSSTGKRVLISRLDKDKILKFYTYGKNPDKLAEEQLENAKQRAIEKYKVEEMRFVENNKKVMGLEHPNIAKVIKVGADSATEETTVISEYALGIPISDATKRLPVANQIPIFLQMIDALLFIHKNGLLHLNLKPKRVRVLMEEIGFKVKLTDFGYALKVGSKGENIYGTPAFSAPEIILQEKDKIGETSDLYSIGAIMYSCMAKAVPFRNREGIQDIQELVDAIAREQEPLKPSERNPTVLDMPYVGGVRYKIDPEKVKRFEEIVMGLIKKDVNDRPIKTASELYDAIVDIFPEAIGTETFSSATLSLRDIM